MSRNHNNLAISTQKIIECDRCHAQFLDGTRLHRFSLSEQGVWVGGISNGLLTQWAESAEHARLCQECADDLCDVWTSFLIDKSYPEG